MKPYYEESGITIYHGDCREVIGGVPMVDLRRNRSALWGWLRNRQAVT